MTDTKSKVLKWGSIIIGSIAMFVTLMTIYTKVVEWSRKVDADIQALQNRVGEKADKIKKDVSKNEEDIDELEEAVKALQKCERDANAKLAEYRIQIENLRWEVRNK